MTFKEIEKVLDEMNVNYSIEDRLGFVEFWTNTAGQDVSTEFDFDGTPEDFINQFVKSAENYDVDDEVELYIGMRGQNGIPNTVKELFDDCEEAKKTLMKIAESLLKIKNED